MKERLRLFAWVWIGVCILIAPSTALALESGEFAALYAAGQYQEVVSLCNGNAGAIASHPDAAEILSYCAQAKAQLGIADAPAAVPEAPAAAPEMPAAPPEDDVFAASPEPPASPPSSFGSAPAPGPIMAPPPSSAPSPSRPTLTRMPSKVSLDLYSIPFAAKEFDKVISLCEDNAAEIQAHPDRDQILKICGQAKIGSFQQSKKMTDLTGAMKDMEKSLKARYDYQASFDLGMARIRTIDTVPKAAEKLDEERKAVKEMWEAIVMRHAVENFNPAVSDLIIVWTVGNPSEDKPGYVDMLIERVIKNKGNVARQRWLAARVRMLADRFSPIDPNTGENETRRNNLEVVKGWMVDLGEKSYFDNDILVGMMAYKADRHEEKYDQSDQTEEEFHKALYFYDEALKNANSNKAQAVLHGKIAFLCSRYRANDKNRLVEFYKKGFLHSRKGLQLIRSVNLRTQESGKMTYRFEEENADVAANLQKAYGNNLTGYIYNLYLEKNYKGVVGLKKQTLDVGFDWENKSDVLLLFAESAKELAAQSIKDERNYEKYKQMALAAGSRAFKFVLKKYGGRPPSGYDEEFCKVFNAYWTYLDSFGQLVQRKSLENQYESYCPQGGAAAPAASAQ